MVMYLVDVMVDEVDKVKLMKVFKMQMEVYFAWALYGVLTLNVLVFFYQFGLNEKDVNGVCNFYLDVLVVDGVYYNLWDVSVDF